MTTSNSKEEDVLLIVPHVRLKKMDGDLYIMDKRIGWMTSASQVFKLTIAYADIKCQRISPADREAVKLQFILHDSSSETLIFANPEGKTKQLEDRDKSKEILQSLLPKFKSTIQLELEEKNRTLHSDPELFQLYKDLVVSSVVTPEEFWANRNSSESSSITDSSSSGYGSASTVSSSSTSSSSSSSVAPPPSQKVGVSAHFLSEIKPQTDGANGMKYNLTGDVISAIFKTYPAVKAKHLELVPHQVSEQDFWIKFFQSHYFHMDRLHLSGVESKAKDSADGDPFAECARLDERRLRAASRVPLPNPLLDLTTHRDDQVIEGFGEESAAGFIPSRNDDSAESRSLRQSSSAQLIRRFNNHSLMVLRASLPDEPSPTAASAAIPVAPAPGKKKPSKKALKRAAAEAALDPVAMAVVAEAKSACVTSKISFEDLSGTEVEKPPELHLNNVDRFLQGPTPHNIDSVDLVDNFDESEMNGGSVLNDKVVRGSQAVVTALANKRWSLNLDACCQEKAALEALRDVSASGQLMRGAGSLPSSRRGVDIDMNGGPDSEICQMHNALMELLRHFWMCFPVSTAQLEEKVKRMQEALVRFLDNKLLPFKNTVQGQQSLRSGVVGPADTAYLEDMLKTALAKFDSWNARKQGQKR